MNVSLLLKDSPRVVRIPLKPGFNLRDLWALEAMLAGRSFQVYPTRDEDGGIQDYYLLMHDADDAIQTMIRLKFGS